jgi:hypothetical protein
MHDPRHVRHSALCRPMRAVQAVGVVDGVRKTIGALGGHRARPAPENRG